MGYGGSTDIEEHVEEVEGSEGDIREGDDRPCREEAELEPPLGRRLMWADGDAWQATNG
jgi:hypothetical protein